ncbi:KxYKxGKxW signal peptide domain-containing protein [Fructilactobacillus myrtifloralis]|uniref:KxYKxGKxW signal peptide domain-containing protein n=1 Tax=Fructilactobacillus myrtifloralis TaxID=2940301 RepID=A0ABY5BNA5_9LACO|nr:KxYKxGKxW signal peptide domain-containing protein [Fructilactobacillus myrtifloralis]USS84691.1 KxYKxGKxW signal peptide domain-containing protein [Fructilactobacillus myrtifloralis]
MENKLHYKMYKAGKIWLFASISTIAFGTGIMLSPNGNKVHADTVATTTTAQAGQTETTQVAPTSEAVTTTNPASEQTSSTDAKNSTDTTVVAQPASTTATNASEATTSTSQASQTTTTSEAATATPGSQATSAVTTESVATSTAVNETNPESAAVSSPATSEVKATPETEPTSTQPSSQPDVTQQTETVQPVSQPNLNKLTTNLAAAPTTAATVVAQGTWPWGNTAHWTYTDDGTLTFDGDGTISSNWASDNNSFDNSDSPIVKYNPKKIVFAAKVTIVNRGADIFSNVPGKITAINGFTGPEVYNNKTSNLESFENLSNLDISGLDRVGRLFEGLNSLKTIDLSQLKPNPNVVLDRNLGDSGYNALFAGDSSLVEIKGLETWKDLRAGLTFNSTFWACSSLQTLDLSNWNTGQSISNTYMLLGTKSLWKLTLNKDHPLLNVPDAAIPNGTDNFNSNPTKGQKIPGTVNPATGDNNIATGQGWRSVGNGTDANPQGTNYPTAKDVANIQGPITDNVFVWRQLAQPVQIEYVNDSKGGAPITGPNVPTQVPGYNGIDSDNPTNAGDQLTIDSSIPAETIVVDGITYKLVPSKNPQVPGFYTNDNQKLTYHYVQQASATINYVDASNGNTIIDSTNLTGTIGDPITGVTEKIAALEKQGYKLKSNNVPATFGEDANQTYTVELEHNILTINPDNPGKPGQPIDPNNPDGPKWPEKTTAEDLKTESTITVHYKYADGRQAAPDATRTVHFTRTATVDAVTGQVTYGAWTPVESANVTVDSPAISGYTPDQGQISVTATAGNNSDQTVTYQANDVKATVKVIDDTTGQTIETHPLTGKNGGQLTNPVDLQALKNKGYVIGSNNVPTTFGPDAEQTYEIHVTHGSVTGTPDNPGKPGQPIDPNNPDGPKWPDGTAADQLQTESTITVHYKYADGSQAAPDATKTVKFTRTVTVDTVTGQVTYGAWIPVDGTNVTIASPRIDGYTPDQAQVSVTATAGNNSNQTVTYAQNPLIVQPIDKDGNPVGPAYPTDPKQPQPQEIPGYKFDHFETKDGKTYAVYTKDDTPAAKDDQITVQPIDEQGNPVGPAYPTDPKNPQAPTIPGYRFKEFQTKAGKTFAVYAKVASQPTEAAKPQAEKPQTQLPQTGQTQNHFLGLLGMLLTTLAGLFRLGKLKKRQ